MYRSVLIICTANVCRSPMAEGVLRTAAAHAGIDVRCGSAGINAAIGQPPALLAVEATTRRGIDISAHRAVQLLPPALRDNDLCLVMESNQRELLTRLAPSIAPKLFTLGHWDKTEIEDPMGEPIESFEHTLTLIEQAVARWLPYLAT